MWRNNSEELKATYNMLYVMIGNFNLCTINIKYIQILSKHIKCINRIRFI